MLVSDLLITLTRVLFIGLAAITVADYLRHRDRIRRDVALVFVSLAGNTLVTLFLAAIGLQVPWLVKLGQIALIAEPYMLLRLVRYFRNVPRNVRWIALIGWVISSIILVVFDAPLRLSLTLPVIVYFIAVNGYSVVAFLREALSSTGVARHRLRFVAAGSLLLIALIAVAGLRLINPEKWPDITPYVQFATILTIVTYYLGFAPPRWLRQSWLFAELQNYLLHELPAQQSPSTSSVLSQLRQGVMRAVDADKVLVALWDREKQTYTLEDIPEAAALRTFNFNEGVFKKAAGQSEPTVVRKSVGLSPELTQLMQAADSEMLFIVPLATNQGAVGLLLVFLKYGSLFVDDDLNILTIFTQQTALLLENFNAMEQQRRYAQTLEYTVQQRTEALQRSNTELRQFAYIASHDLQEPLRMIVSYLQLIESRYVNQLDKDAREFIDFAVDGAKRMKALIEGLLAYSRVETQVENFADVDSLKVLDEVNKLLKVRIDESGATITHDPLPHIHANEPMILQLLQNLVSNAMKYQPKDRKPIIHIAAARKDKDWVFSVKDNGIGIEQKDLERIFVIFQRLHARNEYPGTGIGLAVCKKVVEHHGGKIWVESTLDVGTTFFFTIPAAA